MKKGIWITWELHRRNRGISSALSWPLYEIRSKKSKIIRFTTSIIKTIKVIYRENPKYVVTQNPSLVLSFLATLIKPLFKFVLIIDAHNSGIFPKEGRSKILMIVSLWLQRKGDIILVTNNALKNVVELNGGKACVLPDRIPALQKLNSIDLKGKIKIACISTFHDDEPFNNIIEAGNLIPNDIYIYMTGKFEGKISINTVPSNVKLLGYIEEEKYWSLLTSVDGVMDLTRRENCLVCGAYEGIAVGKPLILSNTKAITEYFSEGCIYVDQSPKNIAEGIIEFADKKKILERQINELHKNLKKNWADQLLTFKEELAKIVNSKFPSKNL
jgi:glycosyltransferase involved in cell wall biosynthesis